MEAESSRMGRAKAESSESFARKSELDGIFRGEYAHERHAPGLDFPQ